MDSINVVTYLNHTEIWDITNTTAVAHPFHIHDIQFYVLDRNGLPIMDNERGQKDVVLVKPSETVRVITKFEDFHNATIPYMYHCHLLHHEDEGMMGSFIVLDSATLAIKENIDLNGVSVYPNPTTEFVHVKFGIENYHDACLTVTNLSGQKMMVKKVFEPIERLDVTTFAKGVYFVSISGPQINVTQKIMIE